MKEYKYVLTRKFPFFKKRPLTQLELIQKRYSEAFNMLPFVVTISGIAMFVGMIKSFIRR